MFWKPFLHIHKQSCASMNGMLMLKANCLLLRLNWCKTQRLWHHLGFVSVGLYRIPTNNLKIKTTYTIAWATCAHSPACAAFLHDLCSVVSRQLAEAVITVNYGPVNNLSVSKQETCLWRFTEKQVTNVSYIYKKELFNNLSFSLSFVL